MTPTHWLYILPPLACAVRSSWRYCGVWRKYCHPAPLNTFFFASKVLDSKFIFNHWPCTARMRNSGAAWMAHRPNADEAVAWVYNSAILVRVAAQCFVRCTTLLPLLRPWNFRFGLHSGTWAIAPCSRTLWECPSSLPPGPSESLPSRLARKPLFSRQTYRARRHAVEMYSTNTPGAF